jgi:hypothetical protein
MGARVLPWLIELRLVFPRAPAREPPAYVSAIVDIVGAEFFAERRLFVENDEEVDAQGDGRNRCDRGWVGVAEHHPKTDPADCEAYIHGISHVAVEPHNDQLLGRNNRGWCTAPCPSKIPDATQATANPRTDGTAASHRQVDAPAVSARKPSHPGRSQNHREKKPIPTANAASAASHRVPEPHVPLLGVRALTIVPAVVRTPKNLTWDWERIDSLGCGRLLGGGVWWGRVRCSGAGGR